jgi:hypothetical protein
VNAESRHLYWHAHGFSLIPVAALAALTIAVAGCTRRPLPETGSHAEQVYVSRCGVCHRPYDPRALTGAMWQRQVQMMERRIAAAGQPPLTAEQRTTILDYLQRNAGKD